MTQIDDIRSWPPGLLNAALFFGIFAFGAIYIVIAKLSGFSAVAVTVVPVSIMFGYAALLAMARLVRLRDDQSGDNLYYMGFLFTLTSLAVSLYQFSASGLAEQIVQNFGIAIASTIAGIALRIFFNQMRRDPVEVEHTARLELAEASRKVRHELEGTVIEFSHFRRATQQSITEALDEVTTALSEARGRIITDLELFVRASKKPLEEAYDQSGAILTQMGERLVQTVEPATKHIEGAGDQLYRALHEACGRVVSELETFARASKRPLEDAYGRSEPLLNTMSERMLQALETATRQMQGAGNELSRSATAMAKSIDSVVAKLTAMKTPEQIIEIKLNPMISGLSRAVNNFAKNAELQAKAVDANLAQMKALSADLVALVDEMRTAQEPDELSPPAVNNSDGAAHPAAPDRAT